MRIASALIALALALPAGPAEFTARVVGFSDGDTLTVLTPEKTQVKVRLHGVDSPETGQDFGARAKQAASALAFGKDVTVRVRDTDRYGRTVADVILPDGKSMNLAIVGQGLAWWYRAYAPGDGALERAEAGARGAKVGVWSQPKPVAPWDWRKGVGVPVAAGVVGNLRPHLYHLPHCRGVAAMEDSNRVVFATDGEAVKAGFRKAGDCGR